MDTQKRYFVVRVNKYPGDYTGRFYAYAVVDDERANSVVSSKYDTREQAQAECDRMEAERRIT